MRVETNVFGSIQRMGGGGRDGALGSVLAQGHLRRSAEGT